ncbi:MAG: YqaA family protein [Planctomycetota bacterium]
MSETDKRAGMLRRLYDWVISLSGRKGAVWALCGISFAESSFFPIPPDPLLMTMSLAKPKRAFHYATACTIASVLGGVLGYILGLYFFNSIVHPLIESLGWSAKWFGTPEGVRVLATSLDKLVEAGLVSQDMTASLGAFLDQISGTLAEYHIYSDGLFFKGILFFNKYGSLTVFVAAFTVIPYKVFTISAGFFGQPIAGFVLVSFLGRGARFFLVSALFYFFGPRIEPWLRRNLELLSILFALLIVVGFLAMKLL